MPTLLIVDDDAAFRESLRRPLQSDYDLSFAASREEALSALGASPPDAVLLDLYLNKTGDRDGLDVLRTIRRQLPHVPVVMVTGQADVEVAVACMSAGASSFLQKRPGMLSEIRLRLREAMQRSLQTFRQEQLEQEFRIIEPREIIGDSECMNEVRALIKQYAELDVDPIFIHGETGTGKELVARAIHANNPKRCNPKPFIPINLSEGSGELVADNLFGHVKGGFTDANEPRIGFLEQVRGGVLFLDEIAEVEPHLQVQLLRVLQERVFKRIGSNVEVHFDAQIVVATNADIEKRMREGHLRDDFVGRLMKQAVTIVLPPLRERREDVPLLAAHFLKSYQQRGWKINTISNSAMDLLYAYDWPFNIRELEGVLKEATMRAMRRKSAEIEPRDIGVDLQRYSPSEEDSPIPSTTPVNTDITHIDLYLARQELSIVRDSIKRWHTKTKAAEQLGYSGKEPRSALHARLKQHKKRFPQLASEFPDLYKN